MDRDHNSNSHPVKIRESHDQIHVIPTLVPAELVAQAESIANKTFEYDDCSIPAVVALKRIVNLTITNELMNQPHS